MRLTAFIIAAVLAAEILLIIFLPAVGWSVLAVLALAILILLLIPIGAHVKFVEGNLSLAAKLSVFEIQLFPKKIKEPKKERKPKEAGAENKQKKSEKKTKEKKKLPFNFEEVLELIKKAIKGLGKFGKLTVHKFMLHYMAAGTDPYKTAVNYAYINAALSSLAPVCRQNLRIKDDIDVCTNIDFTQEKPLIDAELSISLRLIQLVHVAVVIIVGALPVFLRNRKRLAKEKREQIKENKTKSAENNTVETIENIETDERMESHGQ